MPRAVRFAQPDENTVRLFMGNEASVLLVRANTGEVIIHYFVPCVENYNVDLPFFRPLPNPTNASFLHVIIYCEYYVIFKPGPRFHQFSFFPQLFMKY